MADPSSSTYLSELGSYVWQLAAIGVCLLGLAFSSLSEAALMRVETGRVRHLVAEERWGARQLASLTEKRQEVLSSLVLIINMCIIMVSAYTTELTIGLSGGSTRWVPVSSAAMIVLVLVVCEVTPKTYGVRRSEMAGLALAPVLLIVHQVIRPVGQLLYAISLWLNRHIVVRLVGGEVVARTTIFSDDEVMEMVSAGEAEGGIAAEEKDMIHGVIEFADKVAREVMTPRTDMVCLPAETSLIDAARLSKETGYSRLPVYVGTVDHVVGIVNAKDMVSALQSPGPSETAEGGAMLAVGEIARKPAPVVPESKRLGELLPFMQRNRLHMAIVIDEYGGTAGLVTIEDLLEEIFGEIRDEHDFETEPIRVVDEATLVVNARTSTDEIEDRFGVTLPEGDFDSVGGFILHQLGRLPVAGDTVRWENLDFAVEAVSENRIQRVRVIRKPQEGDDDKTGEQRG